MSWVIIAILILGAIGIFVYCKYNLSEKIFTVSFLSSVCCIIILLSQVIYCFSLSNRIKSLDRLEQEILESVFIYEKTENLERKEELFFEITDKIKNYNFIVCEIQGAHKNEKFWKIKMVPIDSENIVPLNINDYFKINTHAKIPT